MNHEAVEKLGDRNKAIGSTDRGYWIKVSAKQNSTVGADAQNAFHFVIAM
jgi:hypothetical protein